LLLLWRNKISDYVHQTSRGNSNCLAAPTIKKSLAAASMLLFLKNFNIFYNIVAATTARLQLLQCYCCSVSFEELNMLLLQCCFTTAEISFEEFLFGALGILSTPNQIGVKIQLVYHVSRSIFSPDSFFISEAREI
jgi:hypothetical protein